MICLFYDIILVGDRMKITQEKDLIIIYDFDGTLTPYALPQYDVIKNCGYDDNKLMELVRIIMNKRNIGLYNAFFLAINYILKENNVKRDIESICVGASRVEYNKGVEEYFESLKNDNVKHYVLTSGYEEYIKRTKINQYLTDVYGTKISIDHKSFKINMLMTDQYKVEVIKSISKINNGEFSNIIYIGDGLTDKYAFEYVHSNGGETILVFMDEKDKTYNMLKHQNIIDYYFKPDFSVGSKLERHIQKRLH